MLTGPDPFQLFQHPFTVSESRQGASYSILKSRWIPHRSNAPIVVYISAEWCCFRFLFHEEGAHHDVAPCYSPKPASKRSQTRLCCPARKNATQEPGQPIAEAALSSPRSNWARSRVASR